MDYHVSLLFFVAAYLLRPALYEFGLVKRYADERQLAIHSGSGDVAFIIVILAAVGFAIMRLTAGEQPEDLYELIGVGLAARALTGLIMAGEYRKAGAMIIGTVGVCWALFIIVEGGLSAASVFGVGVGILSIGLALIARKFPRLMAVVLATLALSQIVFRLHEFRRVDSAMWLFFVTPLAIASACLFLGSGKDDEVVSRKIRAAVFGSLGVGAAIVFTLLAIVGGREVKESPSGKTTTLALGEIVEVQGIPCRGSIFYYKNGKIESCILAREDTLFGQPFPEGTQVSFTQEGVVDCSALPHVVSIQGHLCKGEGPGSWGTCFFPNGQLKLVWLARDEIIQGIPCAYASFWRDVFGGGSGTFFHENGKLASCKLARDASIEDQNFGKGDRVHFDKDGKLVRNKR
jgi:hypothetical protein